MNEGANIIDSVKAFNSKYLNPIASKLDEENRFPTELIEVMSRKGFFGVHYPKEYGGSGYDSFTGQMVAKELAKASAGVALTLHVHWMAVDVLLQYGTEQQKEKYLPDLIRGKKVAAYLISEVNAGSDVAAIKSVAQEKNEKWIINGSKYFCTNGGIADIYLVACKTDLELGAKGISMFIIDKDTPGLEIGKNEEKMGCRSSVTTSIIFKNCTVPNINIIGKMNKGFNIAMYGLTGGRLGMASLGLGIAEAAMEEAINYANEREVFGKPLANLYSIQEMVADMYVKIKTSKLLLKETSEKRDKGENYSIDSSIVKLHVAQTVNDVTSNAMQIFGGHGYMKRNKIERYVRDARLLDIGVGSSEVLKMVVGSSVLKKPTIL